MTVPLSFGITPLIKTILEGSISNVAHACNTIGAAEPWATITGFIKP